MRKKMSILVKIPRRRPGWRAGGSAWACLARAGVVPPPRPPPASAGAGSHRSSSPRTESPPSPPACQQLVREGLGWQIRNESPPPAGRHPNAVPPHTHPIDQVAPVEISVGFGERTLRMWEAARVPRSPLPVACACASAEKKEGERVGGGRSGQDYIILRAGPAQCTSSFFFLEVVSALMACTQRRFRPYWLSSFFFFFFFFSTVQLKSLAYTHIPMNARPYEHLRKTEPT